MAKRGRPPKPKLNPDGLDYGSVYVQIQQAIRLGWPYTVEGNRVRMEAPAGFTEKDASVMAETWLATCYAKRVIDREQYEAGKQFQSSVWRAFGRPFAAAAGGTHGGDEDDKRGAQRFALRCKDVLAMRSRRICDDVTNLCQYDRRPSMERQSEVERLRDGLNALADMIGLRKAA